MNKAELKAKKNFQYILFGGLFFAVLFGVFIYNRFKVTQKQKNSIARQKHLVDEKQKEILDSIKYAKRIQKANLPTEKYIGKNIDRLKQ